MNEGASARCFVGCNTQGWGRPENRRELWGAVTRQQAAGPRSSHGLPWSGPKPERALPRPVLGPGAGETWSVRHHGPACTPGRPALLPAPFHRCPACSLPAGCCSKHCTTYVHASRRPSGRDCYSSCLTEEETEAQRFGRRDWQCRAQPAGAQGQPLDPSGSPLWRLAALPL